MSVSSNCHFIERLFFESSKTGAESLLEYVFFKCSKIYNQSFMIMQGGMTA